IRFNEKDVRKTSRVSMGVIGMNLSYDDEVVAMQLDTQGDYIFMVSEYGMGKRTALSEFTVQHRGGKGVKCYKITEKTGNVVAAKAVYDDTEVMIINTEGIIIQIMVDEVSILGRITSGVKIIDMDSEKKDIVVASMTRVRDTVPDEMETEEKSETEDNSNE
ncbi:MAG: DNA gyrase subunit A, partial [Lachnospiraceae bacterium]|nr:DNA gyrase subunit A [Lachnospiraceae bacterium]